MKNYDDLYERYKKHDPGLPVYAKVGDNVYKAGDAFDYTRKVEVVETYNEKLDKPYYQRDDYATYPEVNTFWNSLYFSSQKEADAKTRLAHSEYGAYQEAIARGEDFNFYESAKRLFPENFTP